jgi:hypothetical protein
MNPPPVPDPYAEGYAAGLRAGRIAELEAIVRWLRRGAGLSGGEPAEEWSDLWVAARDIERGEHLSSAAPDPTADKAQVASLSGRR